MAPFAFIALVLVGAITAIWVIAYLLSVRALARCGRPNREKILSMQHRANLLAMLSIGVAIGTLSEGLTFLSMTQLVLHLGSLAATLFFGTIAVQLRRAATP